MANRHHVNQVTGTKLCGHCNTKMRKNSLKLTCCDCDRDYHFRCLGLSRSNFQKLRNDTAPWYCNDCAAPCGMCNQNVLNIHKAVQCDRCNFWMHTLCCDIDDKTYCELQSTNCTWMCPTCDCLNFSDSFFNESGVSTTNFYEPLTGASD